LPVYFHKEEITFRLKQPAMLKKWIQSVITTAHKKQGILNFIFCSDEYLLKINQQYLKHDYYTDIITFSQTDDAAIISGDIYISIDRVRENADENSFEDELHRVMIHGALHLIGYDDKKPANKKKMQRAEDAWLEKRKF
jgi:rRNA maturation RNase YbeY